MATHQLPRDTNELANMHYNFVRIHKSLRMPPAMKAGLTEHLWEIEDIVALLDQTTP